jgi:hypothetical protein
LFPSLVLILLTIALVINNLLLFNTNLIKRKYIGNRTVKFLILKHYPARVRTSDITHDPNNLLLQFKAFILSVELAQKIP